MPCPPARNGARLVRRVAHQARLPAIPVDRIAGGTACRAFEAVARVVADGQLEASISADDHESWGLVQDGVEPTECLGRLVEARGILISPLAVAPTHFVIIEEPAPSILDDAASRRSPVLPFGGLPSDRRSEMINMPRDCRSQLTELMIPIPFITRPVDNRSLVTGSCLHPLIPS